VAIHFVIIDHYIKSEMVKDTNFSIENKTFSSSMIFSLRSSGIGFYLKFLDSLNDICCFMGYMYDARSYLDE
jgi:hypothetical protein